MNGANCECGEGCRRVERYQSFAESDVEAMVVRIF